MEVLSNSTLSKREMEILYLLAEFKENSEIAEELNISRSTVKAHIMSILNKLNTYSRSQAVIVGLKSGLLKIDDIKVRVKRKSGENYQ